MNPHVLGFVIGSALCGALFLIPTANAQQPLPANSIPYSRGPGITTWAGTTPGPNQIITTDGSSVPTGSSSLPTAAFPALTGDVTTSLGSVSTTLAAGSASVLNSGTLATARLTGFYTGITGTGTLAAGATGSGFTVALGTSTITGTLPSANVSGSYTGLTGTGTLTAGATGAGFTVALGTSTITGTLPNANVSGAYSGLTGTGTLTTGATGAGFTIALGTSTVTGALPAGSFPALTGNVTTSAGSLVTTIAASAVTNAMLAGSIDLATKVTGTLPSTSFPALTGDVTTVAGLVATTIAAGAVTNAMLAGSINLATKVTGTLPSTSFPALTGNVTTSAGSVSTTIANSVITNAMLSPGTFSNITGLGTVTFGTLTGVSVTGLSNPSGASDAANKAYVDAAVTGNRALNPSKYATATVLPNTPAYVNGTAGVGATLTRTGFGTLTVDGSVVALNEIVLVKDQAAPAENGQYFLSVAGNGGASWVLKRCTAADCVVEFDNAATMLSGSFSHITNGSVNANTTYNLVATVATVGTDPATFVLTSSGVSGVASLGGQTGTLSCAASLSCSGATVAVAAAGVTNTMLAGSIDLVTKVTGILPTTSFPVLSGDISTSSGSVVTAIGASKVTNTMLAGSIDLPTKVTGILPTTSFPVLSGDISTSSGSVVTAIGASKVTNTMLAGSIDLPTKVTGILPTTSHPALSGDISTPSGSVVTTIGAAKVTNAMLAGSIDLVTKVIGILPTTSHPALSGDISTPSGSVVTTIGAAKVLNTMLAGSITASKLVGTDIATVGTITSGVWHAGSVGVNIATFSGGMAVLGLSTFGTGVTTGNTATGYNVTVVSTDAKATANDMASLTLLSSDALASNPLQMAISMAGSATPATRYGYIQMSEYGTATFRSLAIQPSGGSVGIGTVAPGAKLSVVGNANLGPGAANSYGTGYDVTITTNTAKAGGAMSNLALLSNDALASNPLQMAIGMVGNATGGSRYGFIQMSEYATASYRYLALQPDGSNVGIGTTAPTTQLHTTSSVRFAGLPNGCLLASSTGVLSNRGTASACAPNTYFADCDVGTYDVAGTDCTTTINAAAAAAEAALGGTVLIPAGSITINCNGGGAASGIVVSRGITIRGQGWEEYKGQQQVPNVPPYTPINPPSGVTRGVAGTYIYTSNTNCTPFTFNSDGTTVGPNNAALKDMAFYQNQGSSGHGGDGATQSKPWFDDLWTATPYEPTILTRSSCNTCGAGQLRIENVMFWGIYEGLRIGHNTNGLDADHNEYGDRVFMRNITSAALYSTVTIRAASDINVFDDMRVSGAISYWGNTNTANWTLDNGAVFRLGRADGPIFHNIYTLGYAFMFWFHNYGGGITAHLQATNVGSDANRWGLYFDAGSDSNTGTITNFVYQAAAPLYPAILDGRAVATNAGSNSNEFAFTNAFMNWGTGYLVDLGGSTGNDFAFVNARVGACNNVNGAANKPFNAGPAGNTITLGGRVRSDATSGAVGHCTTTAPFIDTSFGGTGNEGNIN